MGKAEERFFVKYHCTNCGHEWVERYGKGVRVTRFQGQTVVMCNQPGTHVMGCEVCGTSEDVVVIDRKPISAVV